MIQTLICPCCHQRFKIEAQSNRPELSKVRVPKITPQQKDKMDEIASVLCEYFDIGILELKSATRKRETTLARHYFFYLCLTLTRISPVKIGFYCGGRDRTTTYNGRTQIENLLFTKHKDGLHLEKILGILNPMQSLLKAS